MKTETETKTRAGTETGIRTETKAAAETETRTRAGTETGIRTETKTAAETGARTETKTEERIRALKFTLFSVSAGVIQIGTYVLFYEVLHWAPWLSYLVSLILSVLWNFTFNRAYTFRSDAPVGRSMALVALFYLIFTPLSTWWTAALTGENPFTGAGAAEKPLVNNYLVQAGTMAVNFVTEFLWQRFVVYRGNIDTNQRARNGKAS